MHTIILGLGTNIGNCIENLQRAVDELASYIEITAVSATYITPPWGITNQPDYHNLCLIGKTKLEPETLLKEIKYSEVALGRRPNVRWGPRLIDIDILFYDDLVMHKERLNIPHKHIPERAFVLVPLKEISPEWVHPESGKTVAEMETAVSKDGIKKLETSIIFGQPISG